MSGRTLFIGIDPGGSGGLAVIDAAGTLVEAVKMPETARDVSEFFRQYSSMVRMALLEQVHAMPKQGVSSAFTFGASYGALYMALTAHDVPFGRVTPGVWQKSMGVIRKGRATPTDGVIRAGGTEKKNKTKARAQELFPGTKITHAIADALLIAEHCRRNHGA